MKSKKESLNFNSCGTGHTNLNEHWNQRSADICMYNYRYEPVGSKDIKPHINIERRA